MNPQELKPGESCTITFQEQEVALFNVEGRLYAVSNRCPHRGGPLSRGHLEGASIRCPLHGWLFDLKTGSCLNQPGAKISVYSVTCQEGQVLLNA